MSETIFYKQLLKNQSTSKIYTNKSILFMYVESKILSIKCPVLLNRFLFII